MAAHLSRLNQSIAGKEDSTLLSQIKLLRQESRDGLASLNESFDNYIEQMAKNNADALIEALNDVIRDFNLKISEQFGENFMQLNEAVGRLLEWQEKYKDQVDQMIAVQSKTALNMSEASDRYSKIVEQAGEFTGIATKLDSLLVTLANQREQITSSIATLGALLNTAGDNLPKIESKIVEMTKQIEAGVKNNSEQMLETVRSVTQTMLTNNTEMKKLIMSAAEDANKEVSAHIKLMAENTSKQVVALDKALGDELTKSIETLGEHLTALSNHFVKDYTPLTEKLHALVQAAGRA